MKQANKIMRVFIAILCILTIKINGQNCIQTSQYPSGTIPIAQTGSTTVTGCNFGGEYSVNNFTTVGSYTVSATGGTGNYLTITDNSNNVIVSGVAPLAVTIPSVGLYRIHVSINSSCGTDGSCHTIIVNRVLPPCIQTSQYPSGTVPISQTGTTNVTGCNFGGEYSVNSFTAIGGYTLDATGGVGNFLTITDNSNNVLLSGFPPLAVTIPSVGLYRIHVSTGTSCGTDGSCHSVNVYGVPPPSVVNDFCSAAILMSVPSSTAGTTVGATAESPAPGTCGTTLSQPGVWYKVVGNGNQFGADLCSTSWDSKIFVFSGTCGAWNCVSGNDDNGPICSGASASATWCSVPTTTYYILVTGYSSASAFTVAVTQTVVATPTVVATAANASVCLTTSTSLSATGATTYSWNTGATSASVVVTPTASTVYTVTGLSANGCVSNVKTVSITSIANPTISLSSNSGSICPGGSFTVTASGAVSYTFNGSPSGTVVATTATLSPIVNSTYTVYGTASNGCKSLLANSPTATVTTLVSPTLVVSATPTAICPGATASLSVTGANTYTWIAPASNSTQVSVNPITTTIYTVSGTGTTVCNGIKTITLTVYPTPTITVNSNTICAGSVFTISPTGTATYSYANGSNTITAVTNTAINVTGYSTNNCASAPVVANITVIALPVVTINSATVCSGSQFVFSPSGATSYTFINSSNPITPTISATYSVIGSTTVGCTSLPAVSSITVLPLPVIAVAATPTDMVICNTSPLVLTASGAATYTWNNTTSGATFSGTPSTNGSYFVLATDNNGCSGFASIPYTVNPLPQIALTGNTFVCVGNSSTLTATGGNTYSWTTTDITNSVIVSPTANTIYGVTGSNTFGCSKTLTLAVQVNSIVLVVSSNTAICLGESTNVSATGAVNYTWAPVSLPFATIPVTPLVTTTYTFHALDAKQCPHNGMVTVTVNPLPTVNASASSTLICAQESVTLTGAGASTYVWSTLTGSAGVGSSIVVTLNNTTTFMVIGTSDKGCAGDTTISIEVNKCTGIASNGSSEVSGIKIYPNPTHGVFTIDLINGSVKTIEVIDVTGRLILSTKSEAKTEVLNLGDVANGVYYVKIKSDNATEILKVIKN
ncbi:T9SS type A sorting domain-containing protein [Aurantibacillus circumpalustris]|uniref:T9SS type A sorting domain-containing protein n=1 Tax=Aurantibacillus circumpalustris TaxID=3036359 RepID=UPI00295AB0BD|nr:T9SS type A sorting domain-containing protein [Aurantibacillus circumpalustris]